RGLARQAHVGTAAVVGIGEADAVVALGHAHHLLDGAVARAVAGAGRAVLVEGERRVGGDVLVVGAVRGAVPERVAEAVAVAAFALAGVDAVRAAAVVRVAGIATLAAVAGGAVAVG